MTEVLAGQAGPNDRRLFRLAWIGVLAIVVLMHARAIVHFDAYDPDDYTRLLQVRDWLGGQSWYDTRQYRMNPPLGGDIHWVRLGDLPLAAVLWLLRLVLDGATAELAAMTITPMLQLMLAMWLIDRLMGLLGATPKSRIIALCLIPVMPLLLVNFGPLRVDYHGWQALLALLLTFLLVRARRFDAVGAGLVAALWLTLSLEGFAVLAGIGLWLSWRYFRFGERTHEMFAIGLAGGSVLLTLAFRPPGQFFAPFCDVLSWPHIRAFILASLAAPALRFILGDKVPARRAAALVPLALIAAASIFLPLGACAIRPLAFVDPVARAYYFDVFNEAAPIWKQQLSVALMTLWTGLIVFLGARRALASTAPADEEIRRRWLTLAAGALSAFAASLLVLRAGTNAQLLAVPFAAVLVQHALPRARALRGTVARVLATAACIVFATPAGPVALARPLDRPLAYERLAAPYVSSSSTCDYNRLNALPPGKLFTGISVAPRILAVTRHSVVAGTYHREGAAIADVVRVFAGPDRQARDIVGRYGSAYLAICTSDAEIGYLAAQRRDSLARALLAGTTPPWLEPVEGFARGPLRVYRVASAEPS